MFIELTLAALVGMILGMRFNAFVLGPALLTTAMGAAVRGVAEGHEPRVIAVVMMVTMTSLQVGYVGGSILQVRSPQEARRPPEAAGRRRPELVRN
jgi:hypothetical protein